MDPTQIWVGGGTLCPWGGGGHDIFILVQKRLKKGKKAVKKLLHSHFLNSSAR